MFLPCNLARSSAVPTRFVPSLPLAALLLFFCAAAPMPTPARAQSQAHVFRGPTVYPISRAPIENDVVVVQDGGFSLSNEISSNTKIYLGA